MRGLPQLLYRAQGALVPYKSRYLGVVRLGDFIRSLGALRPNANLEALIQPKDSRRPLQTPRVEPREVRRRDFVGLEAQGL